jgi:hypothetical protein
LFFFVPLIIRHTILPRFRPWILLLLFHFLFILPNCFAIIPSLVYWNHATYYKPRYPLQTTLPTTNLATHYKTKLPTTNLATYYKTTLPTTNHATGYKPRYLLQTMLPQITLPTTKPRYLLHTSLPTTKPPYLLQTSLLTKKLRYPLQTTLPTRNETGT